MSRFSLSAAFSLFALSTLTSPAGVIAVDGDVPAQMNAGGTEADPAQYLIGEAGAMLRDFDGETPVEVGGAGSSHNHLLVRNESAVNSRNTTVGSASNSSSNSVALANSSAWVGEDFVVGGSGQNNSLALESGSVMSTNSMRIGVDATATHNQVSVSGSDTILAVSDSLEVGVAGNGNLLQIFDGGLVGAERVSIGSLSNGNIVNISGRNSALSVADIMEIGAGGLGNALEIQDGGLVAMVNPLFLHLGNFVRLDGGFLAIMGDAVDSFSDRLDSDDSGFQYHDGSGWVTGSADNFEIVYFETEEAAEARTGYAGLGNFTIVTNVLIPEPSAAALALTSFGLAFLIRRR